MTKLERSKDWWMEKARKEGDATPAAGAPDPTPEPERRDYCSLCGGPCCGGVCHQWTAAERCGRRPERQREPNPEAPRRAFALILKIDADTREELGRALEHFGFRLAADDLTRGVTGGYAWGGMYELLTDPTMTHDAYFQEVEAYLKRVAAQPPAEKGPA